HRTARVSQPSPDPFIQSPYAHPYRHSFPTRRSSDLGALEETQRRLGEGAGEDVQSRLSEIEERLDFTERMLAKQRDPERLDTSRSEEHTSELQSPDHLVCRLLLEKKKIEHNQTPSTL